MKKPNEKGFTLPEVLLVLVIAAFLIGLPPMVSASYAEKMDGQLFLEQLQSSVTSIQNEAILNNHRTKMETFRDNNKIVFTVMENKDHPLNHTLELPKGVSLLSLSEEYHFKRGSGNLGNLQRVIFQIGDERVEVVFQMGSGRYEIERSG